MYKRFLATILVCLMLLSLAACDKQPAKKEGTGHIQDGFVLEGNLSSEETVELGKPKSELNPQEVYKKITYTPQMFYGQYELLGQEEARNEFTEQTPRFTWTKKGEEVESCVLPFRICAGRKSTMNHMINFIEEYDWMQVYLPYEYSENQYSWYELYCAYEVQGNKLILKPLDTFEADKETNKITYTFSDLVLEYTFAFNGRNLTLSSGENSVTLTTGRDAYNKHDYIFAEGYLSPDSQSAHNIDYIRMRYDGEENDTSLYFELVGGTGSYNSIAVLQENGLFTFTLALEESQETYQLVYFLGGNDGLVLTDGTNTYYYNDTFSDRYMNNLSKYLTEDQTGQMDGMSEAELGAIVEKTENLVEDLAKAFNDAGIKVTVDEKTGELAMDASVLFGGDSAVLKTDGKQFLNKFIDVYTSIIFSEKYEGFIAKTIIEGHTAPVSGSTYESGLPLSEKRANTVKEYCISSETGVDTSKLAASLEAVGCSNSKPIKDSNGKVDMAASRRVSFRFIINLDK